jgi:23S rRNA (cytidine1920-2'-O)/16S rRNA (cytidine1409-2'-O)-methyltransferase
MTRSDPAAVRLDVALVERGLAPTRARARDAILRGRVQVDGVRADKPALMVSDNASLTVDDPAMTYVSRSALKLIAALDHFGYQATGVTALDVGASTGGFTQVLIERGAARVYAVDVGHDQLHERLAADPRVMNLEGVNARDLTRTIVPEPVGAVVVDASFISLRLLLPPLLALASERAWGVFLAKPQFEVGREHLGKGGIVRDINVARQAADDIAMWLQVELHWDVDGVIASPIEGADGNREYLIGARNG